MTSKTIQIALFLAVIGIFISPVFAQQFSEPNYVIDGGEVLEIKMDTETTSMIILIEPHRKGGDLTITIPRYLLDARVGNTDTDFGIIINGLAYSFFEEIVTPVDRTVTIPFGKYDSEIIITGTHVFSQVAAASTTARTIEPQQQIENLIAEQLRSEIPEGKAKLLIFSDTDWSGAIQASGFDYTEVAGKQDKSIIFGCETSIFRQGIFGAKFKKMTGDGYLQIVAIQNGKIIEQKSTKAQFGEILINGNCVSDVQSGSPRGGCLIATATYGSELAPQVQMLREIRDNSLSQTSSGTAFMKSFNQFYYSFSPYIADYERESPVFREVVKFAITPMISSLSILNYVDMDSEAKVLGYGISLILLNIGMYFAVPAVIIYKIKSRN